MNRRTWQQHRVGSFLATMHLDPFVIERGTAGHPDLARVTRELIALMDSLRLPATWAVSDPAFSAATPLVLRSDVAHELAILGDANWVGPTAGRTRFARELVRRVSQARHAGLNVTTLVPRVASVQRHIDLVVKQHITATAGVVGELQLRRQLAPPRAVHYGVWEFPATAYLPVRPNWLSTGGWSTWWQVRRAVRDAATFHLIIDAPTVASEGRRAEKTIAWLMRRVAMLSDRGLVQVDTLRQSAARLAGVPALSPQQSILRRAA